MWPLLYTDQSITALSSVIYTMIKLMPHICWLTVWGAVRIMHHPYHTKILKFITSYIVDTIKAVWYHFTCSAYYIQVHVCILPKFYRFWRLNLSFWQLNSSSWQINSSSWQMNSSCCQIEFIAFEFVHNKIGSWSKHENKM